MVRAASASATVPISAVERSSIYAVVRTSCHKLMVLNSAGSALYRLGTLAWPVPLQVSALTINDDAIWSVVLDRFNHDSMLLFSVRHLRTNVSNCIGRRHHVVC